MPSFINRKTSPRRAWSARASSASVNSTRAAKNVEYIKIATDLAEYYLQLSIMIKEEGPHHIPVVAVKWPSGTKPRPVDTQPVGLEASMTGCPLDDYGLQRHTASQSAMAAPEADLQQKNKKTQVFTNVLCIATT